MVPDIQLDNGLIRTVRLQEEEQDQRHEAEAQKILKNMEDLRLDIEQKVSQMAEWSNKLRSHALRRRGDLTSGYLAYSNAYARICGALSQGLRRTASVARVLEAAKVSQEENRRWEERRESKAQRTVVEKLSLPSSDDFDQVYGDSVPEVE